MKFTLFILQIFSISAFANQRTFDCQWTHLQTKTLSELDAKITLFSKLYLTEKNQSWNLTFGDIDLSTNDSMGPALKMETTVLKGQYVVYDFWVDGSYAYSLHFDLDTLNAKFYWWETGAEMLVGALKCDVEESP